jgi:hypothetical protein
MIKLFIKIIIATTLISCFNSCTNTLEEKEQTIELSYIAWACDCANWATVENIGKYYDAGDTLAELSVFIEPANKSLELPDTLGYNNDIIKFTGHFYKNKGFPKDYYSIEHPDKARVFRYTKYEIIRSNHKFIKSDTL